MGNTELIELKVESANQAYFLQKMLTVYRCAVFQA